MDSANIYIASKEKISQVDKLSGKINWSTNLPKDLTSKSTIFRMIMGEENSDSGTFSIGETVKIAYVDLLYITSRLSILLIFLSFLI